MNNQKKENFIKNSDFAICIRDPRGRVLTQNKNCLKFCGKRESTTCPSECLTEPRANSGLRKEKLQGIHLFVNSKYLGNLCDIAVISEPKLIWTFVSLKDPNCDKVSLEFRKKGLTKREAEIASLKLLGFTNTEISVRLFISKSTLKTHLNNIYKKIGQIL